MLKIFDKIKSSANYLQSAGLYKKLSYPMNVIVISALTATGIKKDALERQL